ncbi:MAG: phosphoribosylformylglycinamidine cyclo-ligase [Vampirovibrionales bacterium]|nr:phosphoribosylformylglycinamidine cyclo-ligase [Vampirovibrionales bacterium]
MPPSPLPPSAQAYAQAGVNLHMADALVGWAKAAAAQTRRPEQRSGIGGFSAAFKLPTGYQAPVLLAACDGVGTKLELAQSEGDYSSIGIDLVAMSVNDLLAQGGEPVGFLDYIAAGLLEQVWLEALLNSIAQGCVQAGCALMGGETAEMPGFYPQGRFDVAGFCIGVAEEARLYPKQDRLQAGDVLIGLASTGPHSNGYSLIRQRLQATTAQPDWLMPALLAPTQIYVKPVLALLKQLPEAIGAMAHITGGGLIDNVPRVLPEGLSANINPQSWPKAPVWQWLQTTPGCEPLTDAAMAHTFNWGVGYVLIVSKAQADTVLQAWQAMAEAPEAFVIGELIAHEGTPRVFLQ